MATNPDPQSLLSQFCQDLKAAASAIIPLDNIMIGNVELLANGNFWAQIANHGYHLVVGIPSGEANLVRFEGDTEVVMELFFPIPADVTYQWNGPNDTISRLIQAWASYSPWVKGLNRQPVKLTWSKPVLRTHEKPMSCLLHAEAFIISVKFVATMPFIADQIAAPYEEVPVV
jgi:hypothetical protein